VTEKCLDFNLRGNTFKLGGNEKGAGRDLVLRTHQGAAPQASGRRGTEMNTWERMDLQAPWCSHLSYAVHPKMYSDFTRAKCYRQVKSITYRVTFPMLHQHTANKLNSNILTEKNYANIVYTIKHIQFIFCCDPLRR
jgi:hypothetical protein